MRIGMMAAALAAAMVVCPLASAQEPAEPSGEGMYLHDGFYLRMAVGGGRFRDDFKHEITRLFGIGLEGHAEGASGSFEVSAGYALKPGLILGGGVFIEQAVEPKVEIGDADYSDTVSVGTLVMVGPMIEWYVNPEGGFFFGGGPVGARLQIKDESGDLSDHEPVGGGLVANVGYDFWVAEQWSLGIMGRFSVVSLRDDDIIHTVTVASALLSVTYN